MTASDDDVDDIPQLPWKKAHAAWVSRAPPCDSTEVP